MPTGGRPRAIFLGKAGLSSVTPGDLDRKFSLLAEHFDALVVAAAPAQARVRSGVRAVGVPRQVFYLAGPVIGVALAAGRRAAVSCQSPYEAFPAMVTARLLPRRLRPAIVVEMRGDWRTATRLYGRRVRRMLAPVADSCATWAVVHADHIRAIGDYTEALARDAGYKGSASRLTTFSDPGLFTDAPPVAMPSQPAVAYVGALEPTKGVDVLLEAWSAVRANVAEAMLTIVGDGSLRDSLTAEVARLGLEDSVRFVGRLARPQVARVLDDHCLLVLPSRSEGLGRVVMEAHARGRPAVGTRVGGIPEQIDEGVTGVLVPPDDAAALARAIAELLQQPDRMRGMGERARAELTARDPVATYERHAADFARWIEERRAAH